MTFPVCLTFINSTSISVAVKAHRNNSIMKRTYYKVIYYILSVCLLLFLIRKLYEAIT